MEFYTNSISQRTRLRRMKFEGNDSKGRKKQQTDLNNVNGSRHGSNEMTFSSKEDPKKGNRKSISCAKKYPDLVGEAKLVSQFYRSSYGHGDSLDCSSSFHPCKVFDYVHSKGINSRSFEYEGSDGSAREIPKYVSIAAKKEAIETKGKRANDFEVEVTSENYKKGADAENSSRRQGKNIIEVEEIVDSSNDDLYQPQRSIAKLCENPTIEEIIVSSEEDWDEWWRKNDFEDETQENSESENSAESDDSDYVVYDKNDTEEVISDEILENSESEDKEKVGNQSLKKKKVSSWKKKDQMRRKRGSYSDKTLKRKETSERMAKGHKRKKRETYSDEIQEISESEDEATKKSKDKSKKSSREVRSRERESNAKNTLKRKKILKRTKELISEESGDYEDEESVEKQTLKRKEVSSRMKHREIRRKRGGDSDEYLKRKDISERTVKGHMRKKREIYSDENQESSESEDEPTKKRKAKWKKSREVRNEVEVRKPTSNARKECSLNSGDSDEETEALVKKPTTRKHGKMSKKRLTYSDESLKSKETVGRMGKGQMRKKRQTYSDEIQENSDFEDEPTKKSKNKFKKASQEVRSCERKNGDKKALKRNKVLGRKSHEQTDSSPQSVNEEAWTEKDDTDENTSFYDSDKEPISSVLKRKDKKPESNARRECSLQNGDYDEENKEETDALIRKPSKTKHHSQQKDDNLVGQETEKVEERTTKSVSGERDDNEGGEETEKVEESRKRKRIFRKKDDALGTLLKGLLEKDELKEELREELKEEIKEKSKEEEGLEENTEANPPSPIEEPIPYKFRFPDDDEFPPEKEKDEIELMAEGLFDEMYYVMYQSTEIGPSESPKSESESEDEENQYARCRKGKHDELYFDEEIGLRCSFCKDLILESKFVLGDLVDPPKRTSRRDYYREKEEPWYYDDSLEASGNYFHSLEASGGYYQEDCNPSKGTVWDMVPGIRDEMYPHQQEGIEFLWKNLAGTIDLAELKNSDLSGGGGCIISHAPGTGKTRLTIVFLETFLKLFPDIRPVIITPVSIILTWEEEFRKWGVKFPFHNLNNVSIPGRENINCTKDLLRVVKMTNWKKSGGVLGLSYSLFEKLAGEKFTKEKGKTKKMREKAAVDENLKMLRSILLEMPGLVILDEGHVARNQTSSTWNALSNLKTEKCIILSGTPFQNNFEELLNTLSLVRPAIASKLSGEKAFDRQRENKGASNSQELDEAIEKLKTEIAPYVHVHKGSILQKNLPGLRDSVVILSPALMQKGLIESMGILQRQNTFEYEHKVAMVSVHPSLLLHCRNLSEKEKSCFNQKKLEKMKLDYERGVKTRFVIELIRLCEPLDEKVLIFSQYVQPLELIKDQLGKVFSWNDGKQILHIKGKLDQKHRQNIINVFNDPNSSAKVMLASTKCCSEGIHLVGASRVVLLDVVWNPSVERQAICRAYRIGQKKVVYTYHLMTSGTSEGEKYMRQAKKDRISELVFCASSPSKTSEEENEKEMVVQLDDQILEDMVGETRLKGMFKKIILQPKETNFLESFGSESFF